MFFFYSRWLYTFYDLTPEWFDTERGGKCFLTSTLFSKIEKFSINFDVFSIIVLFFAASILGWFFDGIFMDFGPKLAPKKSYGTHLVSSFSASKSILFRKRSFWRFLRSLWHLFGSLLFALGTFWAQFWMILASFLIRNSSCWHLLRRSIFVVLYRF